MRHATGLLFVLAALWARAQEQPAEESLIAKRKKIHQDAMNNVAAGDGMLPAAEPAPKKRGGWLWGGDEEAPVEGNGDAPAGGDAVSPIAASNSTPADKQPAAANADNSPPASGGGEQPAGDGDAEQPDEDKDENKEGDNTESENKEENKDENKDENKEGDKDENHKDDENEEGEKDAEDKDDDKEDKDDDHKDENKDDNADPEGDAVPQENVNATDALRGDATAAAMRPVPVSELGHRWGQRVISPVHASGVSLGDGPIPSGDGQIPDQVPPGDGQVPPGDGQAPAGDSLLPGIVGQSPSGDGPIPPGDGQIPSGDGSANNTFDHVFPRPSSDKRKHRWGSIFQNDAAGVAAVSPEVPVSVEIPLSAEDIPVSEDVSVSENIPVSGYVPVSGNLTGNLMTVEREAGKDFLGQVAPQGVHEMNGPQVDGLEISLGDPGNPERWAVMQRAGLPSAQFKCDVPSSNRLFQVSSLQAASSLLIADDNAQNRLDVDDSDDDMWSIRKPFQILGGGSGGRSDADIIIQLKNFTISTELLTPENEFTNTTGDSIVQVYTSPLVESGVMVVSNNDNVDLVYVCKAQGSARIKLEAVGTGGAPYCFSWVKHCNPTWEGFQILETGSGRTVSEDARVSSDWQPSSSGGSLSFMLTHPGSEGSIRLKGASVSSNNSNLNVTLRGPLDTIINETAPVANIISIMADVAEQVDVIYSCSGSEDEEAQVTLKLYNEAAAVPPLEIPWTARCSSQSLDEVSATMSSCKAKKTGAQTLPQTVAMQKGEVLAEFKEAGVITVNEDDDCTALLFSTESADSVIELFPTHQLIYDRKILMVTNKVGSVETTITGDTLLRFPYVCLDEGTSDVALTVYFKNKSSADFHWKKTCRRPGVHTSAMLTGHHLFAIIMVLFLSSFLLCFISRSRSLTQFILRKLGDCCPWCCRRRQSSSDERTQFTAFGVAV
eukprot:Gregarina_sp_Pseudo_9__3559@NODE_371_length_3019_cov_10_011074_g350_i0_p1_GENE_NODE_371_length_3019_cov_10_011074_g350_i0NODE_371_length_3019_cov_10_011074_g350_i0_p1_ORF_typecomplete_len949_score243_11Coilin_N/PF15862_5/0_084TFIIF_alpha/PF05793_12/0_091Nop14/PF04147_12/0_12CDC27/PF09507_10/0_22Mucin/PF01456_17/3_4SDA1/PF05285_12/2_8Hid1/PF12722_7/7_3SURF2/PF05477_11/9_NODE_371_length_3019_cov_10_011074_g350_i01122958